MLGACPRLTSSLPGALAAAALVAAAPAAARAQGLRETQVHVLGVASRPLFGGAGGALAWRDSRRTRVAASLAAGVLEGGRLAGRADVAWHFLLDPRKRGGSAVYGGGGLSVRADGEGVRPFLLLVLGTERDPGGRGGSFVEVGVGGGLRASAGYRWRKSNAPGR